MKYIAMLLLTVAVLFSGCTDDSGVSDDYKIVVEGENGVLTGGGQYTFLGESGNGNNLLYLGDGGAKVTYTFNSDYEGIMDMYVRISDDALHADGARSVYITVNGEKVTYNHISINTLTDESDWLWQYFAKFNIKKGENTVEIEKIATTSAAFAMDKFAFVMEDQPVE